MKDYEILTNEEKAALWVQLNSRKQPEGHTKISNSKALALMQKIVSDIGQKEVARSWHISECKRTNDEFELWWISGGRESWGTISV